MKTKIVVLLLILIFALSAGGCAPSADLGAARYIDPYRFGGGDVVPDEAPSAAFGKKPPAPPDDETETEQEEPPNAESSGSAASFTLIGL